MNRILRSLSVFVVTALVLSACSLGSGNNKNNTVVQGTQVAPSVDLQAVADTTIPYDTVGQTIQYKYKITNTGTSPLPGVIDWSGVDPKPTCPNVNTVGNNNDLLDTGESVICTSSHVITQANLDAGFIEMTVTANVNGTLSNPVTVKVTTASSKRLSLTKEANPNTYDRAGLTIVYTFTIKNIGSEKLGPTQFTVTDSGLDGGAAFNCGDANASLEINATISCTRSYITTITDMNSDYITTTATASGGGAGPSQPASANVALVTGGTVTATPSSNLTKGSTIQHTVAAGEWLWQIARCYGANPTAVVAANPQILNPAQISPGMVVTVPNIGSNGTIYGPPCVTSYTVVSGDTWASIAQKYNADPTLLQLVNHGVMTVGSKIIVPTNSAGATAYITPIVTPGASGATRISFAPGATSATVTGSAHEGLIPVKYLVNAGQGQTMNVKVTASANSASIAIYAPNGSMLKDADLTPTWSGILPSAGDYRIEVFNSLGPGSGDVAFSLEVSVTGYCADLLRSMKLATTDPAPTHFNICGTKDAATGKTHVSQIYVYQNQQDAGANLITQTIPIPNGIWTPLDDPNALVVADLNNDGFSDFKVMDSPPGGVQVYSIYLYNPTTKQFVFSGTQ